MRGPSSTYRGAMSFDTRADQLPHHEVAWLGPPQPDNPQVAKAEAGPSEQPLAGLAVQELDRETAQELGIKGKIQGVVVTTVDPESDAERAGLMPGDVIREINRKPVTSMKDFDRAASDLKKGQTVLVLVNRRGASLYLSAKI